MSSWEPHKITELDYEGGDIIMEDNKELRAVALHGALELARGKHRLRKRL